MSPAVSSGFASASRSISISTASVIVAGLDDIDGDGVPDVAIGAPSSPSAMATRGDVLIVSGKPFAILHRLAQAQPGELYGSQLALLDDLDGDGVREFAIGAPWAAQPKEPGKSPTGGSVFAVRDPRQMTGRAAPRSSS